jgi:hypothetical protein
MHLAVNLLTAHKLCVFIHSFGILSSFLICLGMVLFVCAKLWWQINRIWKYHFLQMSFAALSVHTDTVCWQSNGIWLSYSNVFDQSQLWPTNQPKSCCKSLGPTVRIVLCKPSVRWFIVWSLIRFNYVCAHKIVYRHRSGKCWKRTINQIDK